MGWVASTECNKIGPDYFGFFASEVAHILSLDEDFLPFSDQIFEKSGKVNGTVQETNCSKNGYNAKEIQSAGGSASLFSDCFGSNISDFRKERLKLLLRQSIVCLSREVDEVVDPVFSVCQLRSCLRYKESLLAVPGVASDSDQGHRPQKKLKASPSLDSESIKSEDLSSGPSGAVMSNDPVKNLDGGHVKKSLSKKDHNELDSNVGAAPEDGNVHSDLQFLLQNDSSKVESVMKKHCDELLATLAHMEEKLEGLLDNVMSNCRLMTLPEKHQLRRLIRDLPPWNLDRVVKIVCRHKQVEKQSCNEVHVDLEKEDKETLWRLYFYVAMVKNAEKLCES